MHRGAALFTGMYDFVAFAEKQELKKSTKVLISRAAVIRQDRLVTIRVVGFHFLWHMVRRMVGVLVEVGGGAMEPEAVRRFLNGMEKDTKNFTAYAHGLFFEKAFDGQQDLDGYLAGTGVVWKGGLS